MHASERTLSRLYRDGLGMTFPQWRTSVRIFTAMVMLAEGATVTDTAHACGWATTSAFVHTFAHAVGITPWQLPRGRWELSVRPDASDVWVSDENGCRSITNRQLGSLR